MEKVRVGIVIDYQNIHLTAHHLFASESPKSASILHPLKLSKTLLARRAILVNQEIAKFELSELRVFRGLPSNKRDPINYAKNLAQKSEWTKDLRVKVDYLPLKYRVKEGLPPQEKGIDVLTALNFVNMAQSGNFELIILLTHDTDLAPALQMASSTAGIKVESAGWSSLNRIRLRDVKLFHTFLTQQNFDDSLDLKNYATKIK